MSGASQFARSLRNMFAAVLETGVAVMEDRFPRQLEDMISFIAAAAGMNRQLPSMIRGR